MNWSSSRRGAIHYICEGKTFRPQKGDLILIPPRRLHMSCINADNKNTIKVQKNGIVIEIFDLSPFLVSWEEKTPEPASTPAPTATPVPDTGDLPKTGGNSSLHLFTMQCSVSLAAIALLR